MNCRRIEEMIPLYVEGDLGPGKANQVAAHLRLCGRCETIASQYRDSQDWLRTFRAPSFDTAVFEDLRKGVLADIEKGTSRRGFFHLVAPSWHNPRFVAASAALLIAVFGAAFYTLRDQPAVLPLSPAALVADGATPPGPAAVTSGVDSRLPDRGHEAAPPVIRHRRGTQVSRLVEDQIAKGSVPDALVTPDTDLLALATATADAVNLTPDLEIDAPPAGAVAPQSEMMRIEIQTSDPNIRIIWLAPKAPDRMPVKLGSETK